MIGIEKMTPTQAKRLKKSKKIYSDYKKMISDGFAATRVRDILCKKYDVKSGAYYKALQRAEEHNLATQLYYGDDDSRAE